MAAAPVELSRREREAVEAQRKKDHYMKLHAEGKTQEAQVLYCTVLNWPCSEPTYIGIHASANPRTHTHPGVFGLTQGWKVGWDPIHGGPSFVVMTWERRKKPR